MSSLQDDLLKVLLHLLHKLTGCICGISLLILGCIRKNGLLQCFLFICPIYLSIRYFSDGVFISLLLREGSSCVSLTLSGFYPSSHSSPFTKTMLTMFLLAASVPPAGFVITNDTRAALLLMTAAKWAPLVGVSPLPCSHPSCTLTSRAHFLNFSRHPFFKWLNSSRLIGSLEVQPACFFSRSWNVAFSFGRLQSLLDKNSLLGF